MAKKVKCAGWQDADAWCGRAGWRLRHVQNPASNSQTVSSALEQGPNNRPETTPETKTGLGNSCAARTCREPAQPRVVQSRDRQQTSRVRSCSTKSGRSRDCRSRPRSRFGHPEQDRQTSSIRGVREYATFGTRVGHITFYARLRFSLSKQIPRLLPPLDPAISASRPQLGFGHWTRTLRVRNAFPAPHKGGADLPKDRQPSGSPALTGTYEGR